MQRDTFAGRRTSGVLSGIAALLYVVTVSACDTDSNDPLAAPPSVARMGQAGLRNGAIPQFPELHDVLQPVAIGVPEERRPWEAGPAALVEWVRRAKGEVAIGFKPVNAARTRLTGTVPGMVRADALSARRAVEALGVRIVRTYSISSTVVTIIDPDLAPAIAALPVVNYLEPLFPMRLATAPRRALLATLQSPQPQDTSWGAHKVNGPGAWRNGHRGSDAFISILDTGVDSTHMFDLYADANDDGFICAYAEGHYWNSCWDDRGHGSLVHGVALSLDNQWGTLESPTDHEATRWSKSAIRWGGALPPPSLAASTGRPQMAKHAK